MHESAEIPSYKQGRCGRAAARYGYRPVFRQCRQPRSAHPRLRRFKVLFDLYPHRNDDGFAKQIDHMIAAEGWRSMSGPANFLKHADRDPDALLASHHPGQGMSIIGLATLLYRRISGDFTLKMRAFDFWIEQEGHDALGIEEIDTNAERAAAHKEVRDAVNVLSHDAKIFFAQKQYRDFLENYDRYVAMVDEAKAAGLTITDILDRKVPK